MFVVVRIKPSLIASVLVRDDHFDYLLSRRLNKVNEILIEVTEGLIDYDVGGHFSRVKPNFLKVLLRGNFAIDFTF